MTYNSNHIEGSKLTEDQTRLIFETRTIDVGDGIPVDDIIETSNHFRAIDYVIDKALEPLSEDIIKHLHLLLKQGTNDSSLDWFAVGDYKSEQIPSAEEKLASRAKSIKRWINSLRILILKVI